MSRGEAGRPVAVVAALAEELTALLARLERARTLRVGGRRFTRGLLGGVECVVGVTGEGRKRAGHGAAALLAHVPVRGLLGLGIAGGLSRDLHDGEVLVAREVWDGGRSFLAEAEWVERALSTGPGARDGNLVTVDEVFFTTMQKADLLASLDAAEPVAADLESAAWAAAAAGAGVPWAAVRVIFDDAETPLPAFLKKCLGPEGHVSRARVVAWAATHPRVAPELLAMKRRMGAAAGRLADFAERFFAAEA